VWGVIASLYVGNAMLLVLNLPLVGLWVKLLSIPRPWLYGGILVVASLGAFSVHRSAGDLLLVALIGIIGFGLRRVGAPVAPVMIGLILGPAAEQHLRRALSISQGDWSVFVTRPLSAALLAVAAAIVVFGITRRPTLQSTHETQ
ncbi:MAG: tripartite tricarboxylate transporter permease, partial [Acidobacteriota bacterium]|nr:tripartite tricarboxylate transporter permease [Acidobacteriota bacterium]